MGVCISLSAYVLGKGMNLLILSPKVRKTGFSKTDKAISLGEGNTLNSNQLYSG